MNLSDGVICFPCLSQEMVGSGIDDAGHVISRRAPRSKVTRVPIWMDIGCRFKVCSTEFDAPSIFGNVASTNQETKRFDLATNFENGIRGVVGNCVISEALAHNKTSSDSENGFRKGCRDTSRQQQSFSGIQSPNVNDISYLSLIFMKNRIAGRAGRAGRADHEEHAQIVRLAH